jgi:hypothetical protein
MLVTLASETLTVGATASGLTVANLVGAKKVTLQTQDPIRYWTSGKAPTTTEGIATIAGETIELELAQATALKMIRVGGADVKMHVEYLDERA